MTETHEARTLRLTGRRGWVGVDLDGTLATYDTWRGPLIIGAPVPRMLERVKAWLDAGTEVRIVTSRACPTLGPDAVTAVEAWCLEHIGKVLPVTNQKDHAMIELWDDRAIQVRSNTGERADGGA